MQSMHRIFTVLIFFTASFFSYAYGQNLQLLKLEADSLYENQRYEQALVHYRQIVSAGSYSPQLLVRMAFIEEANKNYAETLYLLNLYFSQQPDRQVFFKMKELASEQQLSGYEISDREYFFGLLRFYQTQIIVVLLLMAAASFVFLLVSKKRQQSLWAPAAFLFVFLFLAAFSLNSGYGNQTGIVNQQSSYLMDAPSPGSKMLGMVTRGNRFKLVEKNDIWYKVKWQDRTAYIRQSNLWVIN